MTCERKRSLETLYFLVAVYTIQCVHVWPVHVWVVKHVVQLDEGGLAVEEQGYHLSHTHTPLFFHTTKRIVNSTHVVVVDPTWVWDCASHGVLLLGSLAWRASTGTSVRAEASCGHRLHLRMLRDGGAVVVSRDDLRFVSHLVRSGACGACAGVPSVRDESEWWWCVVVVVDASPAAWTVQVDERVAVHDSSPPRRCHVRSHTWSATVDVTHGTRSTPPWNREETRTTGSGTDAATAL